MSMPRRELVGALTQFVAEVSVAFGSSLAGRVIPVIGAVPVAAARQLVLIAVLGPFWRPRRSDFAWRNLWPALALGIALASMNLFFYFAISRMDLGVTVAIEYLGPFAVAIAGSRRLIDAVCALLAAAGVVLCSGIGGPVDVLGLVFVLCAAAAWAAYILLTRRVAHSLPRLGGATMAGIVSAIILVPIACVVAPWGAFTGRIWVLLLVLGVISSAIPYSLDSFVLRRLSARLYGILTALAPAIAAVAGFLVLGQRLTVLEAVGIALVSVAAIVAVASQRGSSTFPEPID